MSRFLGKVVGVLVQAVRANNPHAVEAVDHAERGATISMQAASFAPASTLAINRFRWIIEVVRLTGIPHQKLITSTLVTGMRLIYPNQLHVVKHFGQGHLLSGWNCLGVQGSSPIPDLRT